MVEVGNITSRPETDTEQGHPTPLLSIPVDMHPHIIYIPLFSSFSAHLLTEFSFSIQRHAFC